jgi:uncharacterized protein
MRFRRFAKRIFWLLILLFIFANVVACFHAYKFTHFSTASNAKTKSGEKLSLADKITTLIFGISNPRPENNKLPTQPYETINLQSNRQIECWSIKRENAKGAVILFHSNGAQKSSLLEKSDEFLNLGYSTILVDFMGSGGSEGNQTTVGFKEAAQVNTAYRYAQERGDSNIYLFGSSLGAAAILKAVDEFQLNPEGIIVECPFGSLYTTTCARFRAMGVPAFPMAGLLVFWGGVQNGFWAFSHDPIEYAKNINCPTLLFYGERDEKVSRKEIDEIYANLQGKKELVTFSLSGHDSYFPLYREQWLQKVREILH